MGKTQLKTYPVLTRIVSNFFSVQAKCTAAWTAVASMTSTGLSHAMLQDLLQMPTMLSVFFLPSRQSRPAHCKRYRVNNSSKFELARSMDLGSLATTTSRHLIKNYFIIEISKCLSKRSLTSPQTKIKSQLSSYISLTHLIYSMCRTWNVWSPGGAMRKIITLIRAHDLVIRAHGLVIRAYSWISCRISLKRWIQILIRVRANPCARITKPCARISVINSCARITKPCARITKPCTRINNSCARITKSCARISAAQ